MPLNAHLRSQTQRGVYGNVGDIGEPAEAPLPAVPLQHVILVTPALRFRLSDPQRSRATGQIDNEPPLL